MIHKLLAGKYENAKLFHVRMEFSKEMHDLGKIQIRKLFHLIGIVGKIFFYRVTKGISVLYYPPSGPERIPIYRDMIILIATRWIFSKTIFHFHAGGISEIWNRLNFLERICFRFAFFYPDVAISLSSFVPPDAEFVRAKKTYIIPNGIEDNFSESLVGAKNPSSVNILFIGVLRETKGEFDLLEACKILAEDKKISFSVDVAGSFVSAEIRNRFSKKVKEYNLENCVAYRGVVIGKEKNELYAKADIFCLPTYFESETFSLVVVEAMQFQLPVVSTNWRGVPGSVQDGVNGFLVNIKEPKAIAEKLRKLICDENLRTEMGKKSREIYLQKFTMARFYDEMNKCFSEIAT